MSSSLPLSITSLSSIFRPKLQVSPKTHHFSSLPISLSLSRTKTLDFRRHEARVYPKSSQLWRLSAAPEDISTTSADVPQDVVSAGGGDDGVSVIIQVLLFAAFIALAILTIGVVYIGVSDFLEKREREKFEKEEVAKKAKKGGKKKVVRAKTGPRGFGQKVDEGDLDD